MWRMNIKTDSKNGDPFEFCLKHNVLGVGWRLCNEGEEPYVPKDIEDCEVVGREYYPGQRGFVTAIRAMGAMELDDLIWTRHEGVYYLCRVRGKWYHKVDPENLEKDLENLVDVEFVKVGTQENVPGKVVNCFRPSSTIQRIWHTGSLNMSMFLYNALTNTNTYSVTPPSADEIFDMLHPDDVEEIVGLYLQLEKNYILYTSTNKLDTPKYEIVGIARDGSHLCYTQVKTGNVALDGNDYRDLASNENKVYLFAVSQNYSNTDNEAVIGLKKELLLKFIHENRAILPGKIQAWL